MLDLGFIEDVERILRMCPNGRQTMLFSATMPPPIAKLAETYMYDPVTISITPKKLTVDAIEQAYVEVNPKDKTDRLIEVLKAEEPEQAIVFCRTKIGTARLDRTLRDRRLPSKALHGDMSQGQRDGVMISFKEHKSPLLVATDVAARGLDIEHVTHVINFDLPNNSEIYVHRIGRTGRVGRTGRAITFVTPKERDDLERIEREVKTSIDEWEAPEDRLEHAPRPRRRHTARASRSASRTRPRSEAEEARRRGDSRPDDARQSREAPEPQARRARQALHQPRLAQRHRGGGHPLRADRGRGRPRGLDPRRPDPRAVHLRRPRRRARRAGARPARRDEAQGQADPARVREGVTRVAWAPPAATRSSRAGLSASQRRLPGLAARGRSTWRRRCSAPTSGSEHGWVLWNDAWYCGHTVPGYSLLYPPLGALARAGAARRRLRPRLHRAVRGDRRPRLRRARLARDRLVRPRLDGRPLGGRTSPSRSAWPSDSPRLALQRAAALAAARGGRGRPRQPGRRAVHGARGRRRPVARRRGARAASRAVAGGLPPPARRSRRSRWLPSRPTDISRSPRARVWIPLVLVVARRAGSCRGGAGVRWGALLYLLLGLAAFVAADAARRQRGPVRHDVRRAGAGARAVPAAAVVPAARRRCRCSAGSGRRPSTTSGRRAAIPPTEAAYYAPLVAELERLTGGEPIADPVPPTRTRWEAAYVAERYRSPAAGCASWSPTTSTSSPTGA